MNRTALILAAALTLAACDKNEEANTSTAPIVAVPPAVVAPAAVNFDAVGTEPFWGLKVRDDSLTLSRIDQADRQVAAPKPEAQGETLVWRAEGLNVSITMGECSDGMSDRKFAYTAEVRVGDEILKGCAAKAGGTPTSAPAS